MMKPVAALLLLATLSAVRTLRICHHNDFHARYAEVNRFNSPCTRPDSLQRKCYSGIARIANAVSYFACDVVVHAGDFVQGSAYHSIFGAEIASDAYKWVGYNLAVLGNHEFDQGPADVYEVVNANPDITWIASNVQFTDAPVNFSVVPFAELFDICWVSALTTSTNLISSPGPTVHISDETDALKNAICACSQNHRVIAVNHVGFDKDVQLCRQIPELDVVIGGHSHTNLDDGRYPCKVTRDDGSVCWVVTAYAFGRYLGVLDIYFVDGVARLSGHAYVPMDSRVPQSATLAAELERYTVRLDESIKQPIGVATDPIDGSRESCRRAECQMGNLVCDALLAFAGARQGAQVCLQNGGGLRASIAEGDITIEDVLTVLPFGNVHAVLSVPGRAIVAALENGFLAVSNDEIGGRFPQIGGMTVEVDYHKPAGERVVSVTIGEEPIDLKKEYKLVTNNGVASGGDGYDWAGASDVELSGLGLDELTQRYIAANSPYTPFIEGRIVEL